MSSSSARPLSVGIDARLRHGEGGGVESVIIGLAEGLSSLDGDERYLFLTLRGQDDWIRPHLRGNTRAMPVPSAARHTMQGVRTGIKHRMPRLGRAYRAVRPPTGATVDGPPSSDGTIERAGVKVMHFIHQWGFLTDVPSIYHPHDLQHRHLPELFSAGELAFRESWYPALCEQASVVAVASSWTRNDVIQQMGIPPEKVHVVPWAPPLEVFGSPSSDDLRRVAASLALPPRFILYPAQTWPHKNHVGLVRALDLIRKRDGLVVPVVFTGRRNDDAQSVDALIEHLGLEDQVTWTGFVEPKALAAIYRLASSVVIPSRFEAASGPLWEAFTAGVPAACSSVTSLPTQAGDAALIFDPDDLDRMADAIVRLWTDPRLCETLVVRGRKRVAGFTWDRTARKFRARYRRLAGWPLSDEDWTLLTAPPTI